MHSTNVQIVKKLTTKHDSGQLFDVIDNYDNM